MMHTNRLYGKSNHTMSLLPFRIVILQNNIYVIVNKCLLGVLSDETDGKPAGIMLQRHACLRNSHGSTGKVINNPIVMIIVLDMLSETVSLDFGQGDLAEDLAIHVTEHVDGVWGVLDFIAREEFAEVFGRHFRSAGGAAEGEAIVVFGKLEGER
jgi:hypothetical protein